VLSPLWRFAGRIIVGESSASTDFEPVSGLSRPDPRGTIQPLAALADRFVVAVLLLALASPFGAVARERGPDGRFERRTSAHFALFEDVGLERWSGRGGARAFERQVLAVLENAYDRVGDAIRLRPVLPVRVVVYDPADFDARFAGAFGFRAAGFFDGTIHVRGSREIDGRLVRTLHHEYVHAALAGAAPSLVLPAWVNEGLAEWFENLALGKRRLSAGEYAVLYEGARRGLLPTLPQLSTRSFSHQSEGEAALSYLWSYAAIEHLARRHGDRDLERFVSRLIRSRDLELALRKIYGSSPAELDAALRAELGAS
jgi:hypothetical protein